MGSLAWSHVACRFAHEEITADALERVKQSFQHAKATQNEMDLVISVTARWSFAITVCLSACRNCNGRCGN